jgi:hypothetical protein
VEFLVEKKNIPSFLLLEVIGRSVEEVVVHAFFFLGSL